MQLVTRCESCRGEFVQLSADVYGLPGEKETHAGLMGAVSDLQRGRRTLLIGLRCAWALLLLLLGAAVRKLTW